MAKFFFRTRRIVSVRPETYVIIPSPTGVPTTVKQKGLTVVCGPGNYETDEEEVISRIRADKQFNTPMIREITVRDEKAMAIRSKKLKEAEEEIRKLQKEEAATEKVAEK